MNKIFSCLIKELLIHSGNKNRIQIRGRLDAFGIPMREEPPSVSVCYGCSPLEIHAVTVGCLPRL
jgi:hypothetical protein